MGEATTANGKRILSIISPDSTTLTFDFTSAAIFLALVAVIPSLPDKHAMTVSGEIVMECL